MSDTIRSRSQQLLSRAEAVIPGGVNSPVRAFRNVGGEPLFITSAAGATLRDVDGNEYIDYVGSWGPMILGHAADSVREALDAAIEHGVSFGAPTEREVVFAELLVKHLPPLEMVRMVNSGTEATMSAARLARGYTGRELLIKCNGCYHGHADFFLVQAGSGVATHGISGSAGVPEATVRQTLSVEFNDLAVIEETLQQCGPEKVAAIIVEPVAGNMGLILPQPGYLEGLRALCDQHGIVLIFDEVMCGFRVALGGAAERFAVQPDLATYGKVIGGGLPVGAFGGKKEIMSMLAPVGPVYQAGTLSGNPLAMAAGLAVVQMLVETNPYPSLEQMAGRLASGMQELADAAGVPFVTTYCGSMIGFFFSETPVRNFTEAKNCDQQLFTKFFQGMLKQGVYFAPSAFETGFLSTTHTADQIERTLEAARTVFADI